MPSIKRQYITGPLLPLGALILAFLVSLLVFLIFRPPVDGRIFFYPDNTGSEKGSERRGIPARKNPEAKIEVFLDELFLGPITLEWAPAVPRGTEVRHVVISGKTVYIDLSTEILKTEQNLPVSFDEVLDNLRYNISFNFPRIEEIVFTIEGSQVYAPYYSDNEALE